MHILFEFLPLILFLGAYLYKGIYFAIGTLMVAMPIGFVIKYIRTGKVDKMYMWSTIFLLVFGSAALYFRNADFIYWKPTAFYWAVAVAFLISLWVGEKPLVRRFLELSGELPTDKIAPREWQRLNLVWVVFFAAMGIANIYVAYNFSEKFWVNFKVFGLLALTFVFMLAQGLWLVAKLGGDEPAAETPETD
ncbi:MAG: septation protein A [Gammaproteobacteria bacterium]|jgi:intracellular septation protein|nr:septation protein A [Gammaproteobacteria bacterium]